MKDPWFVVKRYGLGLSPNGWQGWSVTALYVVLIALTALWVERTGASGPALAGLALVLVSFIVVMVLASDGKPWRWRWGDDDRSE
jgi:hypothetical protein